MYLWLYTPVELSVPVGTGSSFSVYAHPAAGTIRPCRDGMLYTPLFCFANLELSVPVGTGYSHHYIFHLNMGTIRPCRDGILLSSLLPCHFQNYPSL